MQALSPMWIKVMAFKKVDLWAAPYISYIHIIYIYTVYIYIYTVYIYIYILKCPSCPCHGSRRDINVSLLHSTELEVPTPVSLC